MAYNYNGYRGVGGWERTRRVDTARTVRDSVGASVLLSLALSGGMTAWEQLSHDAPRMGLQLPYDMTTGTVTDHERMSEHAKQDANYIASSSLEPSIRRVSPSNIPVDMISSQDPLNQVILETDQLHRELDAQHGLSRTVTPDTLNRVLKAYGENGTVTEVTMHTDQVMLDTVQREKLLQIAKDHGMTSLGELQAAYSKQTTPFSFAERGEIERLLVDNPNIPFTMTLSQDDIDYRVSVYDYNAGDQPDGNNDYAIAIEADTTDNHLTGAVALLPLFIPIIRRRDDLRPRGTRAGMRRSADMAYMGPSETMAYMPYEAMARTEDELARTLDNFDRITREHLRMLGIPSEAHRADARTTETAGAGMEVLGGAGGATPETEPAPEEAAAEQPDADIIPFPGRPEESEQPETDEPESERPDLRVIDGEPDDNEAVPDAPDDESADELPAEREPLNLRRLWPIVPIAVLASLAALRGCEAASAPIASASPSPSQTVSSAPARPTTVAAAPSATGTSTPGEGQPGSGVAVAPRPVNPTEVSIDALRYARGSGTTHEALGILPSLTIAPRLTRVDLAPEPHPAQPGVPERPPGAPTWQVTPGMGGYDLMTQNGFPAAAWNEVSGQLLRDFPADFYVMPDGSVGLSHSGTLPPAVSAEIEHLLHR